MCDGQKTVQQLLGQLIQLREQYRKVEQLERTSEEYTTTRANIIYALYTFRDEDLLKSKIDIKELIDVYASYNSLIARINDYANL